MNGIEETISTMTLLFIVLPLGVLMWFGVVFIIVTGVQAWRNDK